MDSFDKLKAQKDAIVERRRTALERDARELATGVLDMKVGCLAPKEMREVAARIIRATS